MPSGFDYSKWDKLELSDDEDDHPGAKFIEENTLRRIKRESHERQEAERAAKVAELEKTIEAETEKLNELTRSSTSSTTAGDAEKRDDAEKVRILGAIASARAEIEKEERERKFNADEMCYVASERSLVGAQCKPDAGDSDLDYEGYVKKYGGELEALARASFSERGLEDMAEFFKTRAHLLTEHSMGWMLLKCLRMEMQGDTNGMKRAAKTGYALKSILDFAEAGKKPMKDAARPFFNRLAEEPRVFAEYTAAYEDYCAKLRERAVAKKREEEEEALEEGKEGKSLEEIPREQRLGPGGLDPVEVFESLPEAMRDAFESGSVDALRDYVNALPMEEARTHMRRMVDSGLWVATPGQEGTALRDPEDPEDPPQDPPAPGEDREREPE